MSLYKQIFLDALSVLKRYRSLWIFGLLALLFGGSIEGDIYYNFINPEKNSVYDLATRLNNGLFNKESLLNLPGNIVSSATSAGSLWLTALIVLLVIAIVLLLSVASHLIIIEQSASLFKSPRATATSLKATMVEALPRLRHTILKLSLTNIIFKLFIILAFLLVGAPLLFNSQLSQIGSDFTYLLLFIFVMPVVILASVALRYLMIGMTLNKTSFNQALRDAWSLLQANHLLSLEFSIIAFIFSVLVIFLTLLIISGLSIILFFLALAAQNFSYQAYVIVIAASYIIMFAIFLLSNALVSGFTISAWTSLYLQLTKKAANSNNQGLLGSIRPKLD